MATLIKQLFQKSREFENFVDPKSALDIFKDVGNKSGIYLAGYDVPVLARYKGSKSDGSETFELETIVELPNSKFKVYTVATDYVEAEFELLNQMETTITGNIISSRKSTVVRKEGRNDKVFGNVQASKFLIAKLDIDFAKIAGVSSQVILTDIHKHLMEGYPNSKVNFLSNFNSSEELDLIKQFKMPLYVLDTATLKSPKDLPIIDIKKSFEEDFILEEKIAHYRVRKIGSFLYYPVFIRLKEPQLFAILTVETERPSVPMKVFEIFQQIEADFNAKILDSNTTIVDVRQNILNLSRSGMALEIRSQQIIQALMIRPSMTIDINFKMQAPIRMALEVRHLEQINDFHIVGLEIVGISGDSRGKEVYESLLDFIK